MRTYVVVGGGLGGAKAVEELRDLDGEARIVLIDGEELLPYERPPLSKEYLLGEKKLDEFTPLSAGWFTDNQVEARVGIFATDLDAEQQIVHLSDGTSIHYDGLVLATGSRPRTVNLPGVARPGVQVLRTLAESDQLKSALESGGPLVIYGGGWIGLEVAAAARTRDVPVTVVVREDKVLRQLGDEIGDRFLAMHRDHGVVFELNATIASIDGDGDSGPVTGVTLGDGRKVDASHVLIAVGADPRVELASAAGLEVDDGVVVDDTLVTSDPHIVAVGDIANAQNTWVGDRIRVQHWAAALKMPEVAARTLVGDDAHYDAPPYFYTDQYDLGMEFRGLIPENARLVQRGGDDEYIVFWLRKDDVLRAAMNVNVWDQGDAIEEILKSEKPVDPDKLADPNVPLGEVSAG